MWNPEARDSSPIIFTFMSSWERTKMPPLLGRRRTRSNRAGKSTAVEDSLVTQWKMSKMPPLPGRRGKRWDAAAGEEETRDSGARRKYTAVEDLAPLLRGMPQRGTRSSGETKPTMSLESAGKRIKASEECVSLCKYIIFTCSIFNGVRPGLSVPLATRDLGSKPHCTSAQPFRL